MDLEAFDREAEPFCRALNSSLYIERAGLPEPPPLGPVYERFAHLVDEEAVESIQANSGDEKRKRFALAFVGTHYLERAGLALTERILALERSTVVDWFGAAVPYRAARAAWSVHPETDGRRELYRRWASTNAELNKLKLERLGIVREVAPELGGSHYLAGLAERAGIDLDALQKVAHDVLARTRAAHQTGLRQALEAVELEPADCGPADLDWALRAVRLDTSFGREGPEACIYATFNLLGLPLQNQSQLKLDLEYRPYKVERAFVAAVEVPQDVRLGLQPKGGQSDLMALLDQIGQAEQLAQLDPALPASNRRAGDQAVAYAYGWLFLSLAANSSWVRLCLGDREDDHLKLGRFYRLHRLRQCCAMLIYLAALLQALDPQLLADWYVELFQEHLSLQFLPETYLTGIEAPLRPAQLLRGCMLGAQLEAYLLEEFEQEWFRLPQARKFLVELWREGFRYTAEEIATFLGQDGLAPEPMFERLRTSAG